MQAGKRNVVWHWHAMQVARRLDTLVTMMAWRRRRVRLLGCSCRADDAAFTPARKICPSVEIPGPLGVRPSDEPAGGYAPAGIEAVVECDG